MIDVNDPKQSEWLKLVNEELGNQLTSNAAFVTQIKFMNLEMTALISRIADLEKQNSDMGLTNATLRNDNLAMRHTNADFLSRIEALEAKKKK